MNKFNGRSYLQPLLFATALPLVLLAEGAAPAVAGSVSVTGANGTTSFMEGRPERVARPQP
jgi:hypothetical protein